MNKEPDNFFTYTDGVRLRKTPVVIDNGSYECRVGWASDESPRMIFKNITAKQRGKKESDVQVGNDIANVEAVRWLLKTQFDRNVVTHFDIQEHIFDHIFSHLGIPTENRVDHPIVLTEVIGNPSYYRQSECRRYFLVIRGNICINTALQICLNCSSNIIVCPKYSTALMHCSACTTTAPRNRRMQWCCLLDITQHTSSLC